MKALHKDLFDFLIEFDEFCKNHQIEYALAWGTLLGAVRENHFIEWDDDVDLIMTQEGLEKLKQLSDQFPKDISFKFSKRVAEEKYSSSHIIYKNSIIVKGDNDKDFPLFMDIFSLGNIGSYARVASKIAFFIKARKKYSKYSCKRIVINMLKPYLNIIQKICFKYSFKQVKKNYLHYDCDFYEIYIHRKENILPFRRDIRYNLYGFVFPVPNNPEHILEDLYGKNWKVPYKDPNKNHYK